MTYSEKQREDWAGAAAHFMRRHGHTEADKPVTVAEIAEAAGFHPCQWQSVKAWMFKLGYHPSRKPGAGGGFYLGESGEEATGLVYEQKAVLTRIASITKLLHIIAHQPYFADVLAFSSEKLDYDLRSFATAIGSHAPQLALPAPDMIRKSREAA